MALDAKYDHYDYPTESTEALNGHLGHLTPEQTAQLHQLRMTLEAEGYTERLDTLSLLRFLRARKFDVTTAKKMFVDCEDWRKKTQLDELLPTWQYPEKRALHQYYPQFYHKTDKDGRPVYIEQLGGINLNAMYKITTQERMLMNLAVEYERMADPRLPACSRKAGRLLETCCTIMDLKGVSLGKIPSVYAYVKQTAGISQNYYPERLGKLYLINAPWGFSTVWSVIKGWLDPVTVKKINIHGSDYVPRLLEQIPADHLPKLLGGNCACEGECAFSDAGPWREEKWSRPAKWEAAAGAGTGKSDKSSADKKDGPSTLPLQDVREVVLKDAEEDSDAPAIVQATQAA